jgi:4-hydroxybenzoate polyprenyltransferase
MVEITEEEIGRRTSAAFTFGGVVTLLVYSFLIAVSGLQWWEGVLWVAVGLFGYHFICSVIQNRKKPKKEVK